MQFGNILEYKKSPVNIMEYVIYSGYNCFISETRNTIMHLHKKADTHKKEGLLSYSAVITVISYAIFIL